MSQPQRARTRHRRGAASLPALRPHRQQRHQLPGVLRGRLRLLTSATLTWTAATALAILAVAGPLPGTGMGGSSRAADFGRWASSTSRCTWQRGPSTLRYDCHGLRFEQQRAGHLSVRFLAEGVREPVALQQLVFSGVLEPGQEGMRCGGDGHCQPSWPTRLTVATVADARFDGRGLAIGLPRTRLARGHCQLERDGVRCEARGRGGETWMAEASLPGQPQLTGEGLR